jgi:hypothetical protein
MLFVGCASANATANATANAPVRLQVDMWHALAAEPGKEVVFARARDWLLARLNSNSTLLPS